MHQALKQKSVQLTHEAIDKSGNNGLPWALLTLVLDTSCPDESKATEIRNAQHKAHLLASDAAGEANQIEKMPFLELESLLLDLQFGEMALQTHAFTVNQPGAESVKTQINMCKAQAMAMIGESDTAVSILTNLVRSRGVSRIS